MPHKGKLLAGTAVFGSSFLATMRWLFGVWLPSAHQVGLWGGRWTQAGSWQNLPGWHGISWAACRGWEGNMMAPAAIGCDFVVESSAQSAPPPQVLHHPLTLSYLGLSGLAGLALTYYYNNTENRKVV